MKDQIIIQEAKRVLNAELAGIKSLSKESFVRIQIYANEQT